MKAECPDQIFVLQQLRQISQQVEAENRRRANLVVWSSSSSTHRQFVIDCRPVQGVLVVLVQLKIRRRRWLMSAQGWGRQPATLGKPFKYTQNPERVRRLANPYRVPIHVTF